MLICPTDSTSTNQYHTATLKQVLACNETVLSTGTIVVAHKSAKGVQTKPSFHNYHPLQMELSEKGVAEFLYRQIEWSQ